VPARYRPVQDIDDQFGHAAGDEVIRERLNTIVFGTNGGDVLLPLP
jgi:GGDEF domain-containing protein